MRELPRLHEFEAAVGDDVVAAARFGVPEASSLHVRRPRLTAALTRAEGLPLVVVSAPAGTGKTAVVAEWVRGSHDRTTCWVDFAEGESSFWDPVLESLRRHGLGVPASWSVPPGSGLGAQRLSALVGLVVGSPHRWSVVVDGYELASREIAREVDLLLRHSLGQLTLVFLGRVDPILPLYRYRLNDALLEVRAPDLAFSDEEAGALIRWTGVELDDVAVHDLNKRLGGWAAGLRFAARALATKADAQGYAAQVVEQVTDINEYLVTEVLDAQPPETRRVLLDTCVTDVFSAELAELAGGAGAVHAMADLVDRRAFVEPVPGQPEYFRYFPFFRNLLLAVLSYESPERLEQLRRIASSWYRAHGRYVRSLEQLAMIDDWRSVATQLVEDGLVGRVLLEDDGRALSRLAARIPADVDGPAACVVRAAIALRLGEAGTERCARELASARRALRGGNPDPGQLVSIAVTDALRGCLTDDPGKAAARAAHAERLLAGMPATATRRETSEQAAIVAFAVGITSLRVGHLAEARAGLSRAAALAPAGAAAAFRSDCLGHLAVADALQGELVAAVRHAEEALTVASRAGLDHADVPPSAHVALAWVGVERCDPTLTEEHVTVARSSRLLPGDPFSRSLVEAAVAALEESTGSGQAAIERLEAAAAGSATCDPWLADRLRVEAARLMMREGDPARALEVLESAQVADRPEVSVASAAVLAEQGYPCAVNGLSREGVAPLDVQVRALLVEASQLARPDSPGRAEPALSRALRLAARERIRRPFRDVAPSVGRLLAADPRLAVEHEWLQRAGTGPGSSRPASGRPALSIVVEPLTPKELEVLTQMEALLTTEEIAHKMVVSVNTVRTHIRHILRKLGVNRRNAAIRRARELGILGG